MGRRERELVATRMPSRGEGKTNMERTDRAELKSYRVDPCSHLPIYNHPCLKLGVVYNIATAMIHTYGIAYILSVASHRNRHQSMGIYGYLPSHYMRYNTAPSLSDDSEKWRSANANSTRRKSSSHLGLLYIEFYNDDDDYAQRLPCHTIPHRHPVLSFSFPPFFFFLSWD